MFMMILIYSIVTVVCCYLAYIKGINDGQKQAMQVFRDEAIKNKKATLNNGTMEWL